MQREQHSTEEIEELREENEELRRKVRDLEARCEGISRRFSTLVEVMLGDADELGTYEPDEMRDVLQRVVDLEDTVADHENQVAMVSADGGNQIDTPDERAKRLRQILYNRAKKNNGKAALDRDGVDGALGGGHHRGTVLDAMKRAADGREADINGSSELPPLNGLTLHIGRKKDEQSRIEMDLTNVTGSDLRKNLTTKDGANPPGDSP